LVAPWLDVLPRQRSAVYATIQVLKRIVATL